MKRAVKVSEEKIEIPAYYERVKKIPIEFKGKLLYATGTESAACLALFGSDEIDGKSFDRDLLIQSIHEGLEDNQGVIEVGAGELNDRPFIYSIIKTLNTNDEGFSSGVQYDLSMDLAGNESSTHVQGLFIERGVTGTRDSVVFAMKRKEADSLEEALDGWARDPYDPLRKTGALMNQSEREEFDSMFPEHPLSMARAFLHCILGHDEELAPATERLDESVLGGKADSPLAEAAGKFFEKTSETAKELAGKAGNTAGVIADAVQDAANKVAEAAGGAKAAATEAVGVIGGKIDELRGVNDEPDEYDLAVIAYNQAYTDLNDAGIELLRQRERCVDLIGHVENLINSIANHPKTFDSDMGKVSSQKKEFSAVGEFAKQELAAARESAAGVGAGVTAGLAVANMAPTAALWVATTFGTASTGTAISTLSGAAASQAALAWLGGGALAAGGGGTAAGSALLALAGPVGWSIAGATLLLSIVIFNKKRIDIREAKQKELSAVKENTETVAKTGALIGNLVVKTNGLREKLSEQYRQCVKLFGTDYSKLDEEDQKRLASLVNNTLSLSQLLNERIIQEEDSEEQGED